MLHPYTDSCPLTLQYVGSLRFTLYCLLAILYFSHRYTPGPQLWLTSLKVSCELCSGHNTAPGYTHIKGVNHAAGCERNHCAQTSCVSDTPAESIHCNHMPRKPHNTAHGHNMQPSNGSIVGCVCTSANKNADVKVHEYNTSYNIKHKTMLRAARNLT